MSRWTRRPADYWQSSPYPGERPDCSWRLVDGWVHRLTPVGCAWLDMATGETVEVAGRDFILAYGSNANPTKLHNRGVDAVMLQAKITDAQAVWCNARRKDGTVVATLVKVAEHGEPCPVLALRPKELPTVDGWEKPAYILETFWGSCNLESEATITPKVYVGGRKRQPLRIDGTYAPLHQIEYAVVDRIVQ